MDDDAENVSDETRMRSIPFDEPGRTSSLLV